jgi:hypothetical protein
MVVVIAGLITFKFQTSKHAKEKAAIMSLQKETDPARERLPDSEMFKSQ